MILIRDGKLCLISCRSYDKCGKIYEHIGFMQLCNGLMSSYRLLKIVYDLYTDTYKYDRYTYFIMTLVIFL